MPEFTKGEWKTNFNFTDKTEYGAVVWSDSNPPTRICAVGLTNTEANARLIAAAPEMYEALKECLEELEAAYVKEGISNPKFDNWQKALAKAEGK